MSTQFLKAEFLTYLAAKNGAVGQDSAPKYNTEAGDLCITLYASEFKEFLSSSHYADSSVLSKSIGEILAMDFENGRLVDKDEETTDTFESESKDGQEQEPGSQLNQESMLDFISAVDSGMALAPAAEATPSAETPVLIGAQTSASTSPDASTTSGSTQAEQTTSESPSTQTPEVPTSQTTKDRQAGYSQDVQSLLEEIYNSPEALQYLDINGDGKIDDGEKLLFEKYVQGDKENLTAEDLQKALQEMKEGKFNYDPTSVDIEELTKPTTPTSPTTPTTPTTAPQQTQQSSGAGGGGGGGGGGGYSSSAKQKDPNDVKNMTLEQLQAEKTKREQTVKDRENDVNSVYDGTNANVAKAQKEYDTAKEAYQTALEKDDKVKQETKDRQQANLQDIETTREQINTLNTQKTTLDGQVSAAESVVTADESNIAALEAAVASYDSESAGDSEDQEAIAERKAEAERQLEEAKAKKEEDQATVDSLKAQQTELDTSIQEQEARMTELEAARKEIEDEIMSTASDETKEALKSFQEAKDGENGLDTVREKELSIAKQNLATAQTGLDEVNDAINVKQSNQTQWDLGFKDFSRIVELAKKYDGMNHYEIGQIMKELGYSYHDGVYCADFVEMILTEALGEDNLPEWYKNVSNKASCPSIQHQAAGHEVSREEAQPGDIVLFDWDGDGTADHIGIYMGDASDQDPNGIWTIEGNTEHGGVNTELRYMGSVLGIYSVRDK